MRVLFRRRGRRRIRDLEAEISVLERRIEAEQADHRELAALGQEGAREIALQLEVAWLEIEHLRELLLAADPQICCCINSSRAFALDCPVHRMEDDLVGGVEDGHLVDRNPLRSPEL